MGGSNGKLQDISNRLVDKTRAYGMEVSTEKSRTMTNSMNGTHAYVSMNGQKLEEVTSFEDSICSAEIRIRIASAFLPPAFR